MLLVRGAESGPGESRVNERDFVYHASSTGSGPHDGRHAKRTPQNELRATLRKLPMSEVDGLRRLK
jgi:hypothetical protein